MADKTPKKRQGTIDFFVTKTPTKMLARASISDDPLPVFSTSSTNSDLTIVSPQPTITPLDESVTSPGNNQTTMPLDLGTEKPKQPKLLAFPKDAHERKFLSTWYSQYDWLEYSVSKNAAYCFACRQFSTGAVSKTEPFQKLEPF